MEPTQRDGTTSATRFPEIAFLFVLMVLFELIQNTLFGSLPRPGWALIFTLYLGWYSTPVKGAVIGSVFGVVQDYLLGMFMGLNGMSKTIAGFSAHYLNRWLASESRYLRGFLIALLAACDRLFIWLVLSFLPGPGRPLSATNILVHAFLTGFMGALAFWVFNLFRGTPKDFRRL
jgi:rod shape-determining protein MreD